MQSRTIRLLLLVPFLAACGDAEREAAPEVAGAAAATAAPEPADPCSLIPVADWVSATGHADIYADRSARDTCDFLSDDMVGVVGSVVLPGRAMMEHPPRIAGEPEPIAGLGDEALWLSLGPIVRVGDTVVWVTVHPSVENRREVGIALARIAIERL